MKKRNVLPACKNGPSAGLEEWPTCYQPGRTHTYVESSQSFIPPWSASLEGTMHPLHNEMEERRPQLCQYSLPLRAKFALSSAKIWKPQNGIKHANILAQNGIPQMWSGSSLNYFWSREVVHVSRPVSVVFEIRKRLVEKWKRHRRDGMFSYCFQP
jgi:hypothetical protein